MSTQKLTLNVGLSGTDEMTQKIERVGAAIEALENAMRELSDDMENKYVLVSGERIDPTICPYCGSGEGTYVDYTDEDHHTDEWACEFCCKSYEVHYFARVTKIVKTDMETRRCL